MLASSDIGPFVADARGYEWVTDRGRLDELGFSARQAELVPGLLIPTHGVVAGAGDVGYQFRPEKPRVIEREGSEPKVIKYESRDGFANRLDCPPLSRHLLDDPSTVLYWTEGAKKADSAASRGLLCVTAPGVDLGPEALTDLDSIPLDGRPVFIAFDSDVMTKPTVRDALQRLTVHLASRGASVRWIELPELAAPEDIFGEPSKTGLDDYFARGGTVDALSLHQRVPRLTVRNDGDFEQAVDTLTLGLQVQNDPPALFNRGALIEVDADSVREVSHLRLEVLIGRSVDSTKTVKGGPVPDHPSQRLAKAVLHNADRWRFPQLDRVTRGPTFAPDGTLRVKPGYHASSRTLYLPNELVTIGPIAHPSRSEIDSAVELITGDLLGQFPFVAEADRAHAVALALLPLVRDLIDGPTPLHGIGAPGGGAGTGKTKLAASTLAPALGSVGEGLGAPPSSNEEMSKQITAVLVEGHELVMFDNADREVNYPALQAALTTMVWTGRILGETRTVTVANRATWVITGNALRFVWDLARRVLPINLDAGMERPMDRTGWRRELPAWAIGEGRADLLHALCVLVTAWLARGRPAPPPSVPAFGSFERYRDVIGGILAVAGIGGFLGNIDQHSKSDEAANRREVVFCAVSEVHRDNWFTAGDVVALIGKDDESAALFDNHGRPGHSLNTKVGNFLKGETGSYADGRRLVRSDDKYQNRWRYRLEEVGS
ncbi:DUF3854 domain-containing protein [Ilumatobacter coccineus]|nr:DUF3854 domain-containing protein [Ilumatobacter coccineus]